MGHSSARMTDLCTDVDALDQGGHTEAVAQFLGMTDGAAGAESRGRPAETPRQAPPPEMRVSCYRPRRFSLASSRDTRT
jgi:hypothetical protein